MSRPWAPPLAERHARPTEPQTGAIAGRAGEAWIAACRARAPLAAPRPPLVSLARGRARAGAAMASPQPNGQPNGAPAFAPGARAGAAAGAAPAPRAASDSVSSWLSGSLTDALSRASASVQRLAEEAEFPPDPARARGACATHAQTQCRLGAKHGG